MAIAQSKGKPRGTPPTLSTAPVRVKDSGDDTIVELAELFKASRPMVYWVLERSRARDSDAGEISGTGIRGNFSFAPACSLIS